MSLDFKEEEPEEIKGCSNCSHHPWTAISCIRGTCTPTYNTICKYNTWRKK